MNSVTGSEGINFVFKIRGYKGNGNNIGVNFMMPLSDSVTVAWYDDNGDSLPVTLRINPKFFNGIPYGAQDSHTFVHPEDTQNSYSVGVSYYDSTTDVWCKDSSGALLAYSHTLPTGDSVSVPAPDKYCTGVAVIGMNEIGSDSVSNGRVLRTYSSITGGSCKSQPTYCMRPIDHIGLLSIKALVQPQAA